jgi:hypothetical protein
MKKKFRHLLSTIGGLSVTEQKDQLEETFIQWRGSNPQTDDILVVGFKLT